MRRLASEPLLHFLLAALAVFAIYEIRNPSGSPESAEIVVSASRIEQLAGGFSRSWQRPPTDREMKGLIDEFVKEEVLNREALARGLDKDDPTIRRRLRLKMEYVFELEDTALQPSPEQVEAYFKANSARYETEPEYAFEQIYFNPAARARTIDADAAAALRSLRAGETDDAQTLGDPTLMPFASPLAGRRAIESVFGSRFAAALADAPLGQWSGPIVSSFGLHLVRVSAGKPARTPKLSDLHQTVRRDWIADEGAKRQAERVARLLERYKVRLELPPAKVSQ